MSATKRVSSFGDRLWAAAVESWGGLATSLGLVLALLALFLTPADTIPTRWALVAFIVLVWATLVAIRAAFDAHKSAAQLVFPSVRMVRNPPAEYLRATALIILDSTDLLSYDSMVSVYLLENEVELFLGVGKVANIQGNGLIQVVTEAVNERLEELKKNEKDALNRVVVKPFVPSMHFGRQME